MKAISIILVSALITTAAIKAAPALAEAPAPAGETNVSLVRTADLDLGSETGRRQLDRRLERASREVCGSASDADIEGKNEVRRCRAETLAKARGERDRRIVAAAGEPLIAVTAAR